MKLADKIRNGLLAYVLVGLLLVTVKPVLAQSTSPNSEDVYKAVVAGTNCHTLRLKSKVFRHCRYSVGKSLDFVINGVGDDNVGITFLKSGFFDGDYYASVGIGSDCVIVQSTYKPLPLMVFVSTRNGKVYQSLPECEAARKE